MTDQTSAQDVAELKLDGEIAGLSEQRRQGFISATEYRDMKRAAIKAAIQAERARVIEDVWQPMETAPRTGVFWAWRQDLQRAQLWDAAAYWKNYGRDWPGEIVKAAGQLTHWMRFSPPQTAIRALASAGTAGDAGRGR